MMNPMNPEILEIDGSILEGGGQILRISVALSVIKRVPIRIKNIRAGRKKPGLAQQHLKGIILARDMCDGDLKNANVGSTDITFIPGKLKAGNFSSNITTAGSVALLMQVAIPCGLFAPGPTSLSLFGGTDADLAPPIDYIRIITSDLFQRFGANFSTKVIKRGFFPRGGGEVQVHIDNLINGLKPIELIHPGRLSKINGYANVGGSCPKRVGDELKQGAESLLLEKFDCKPEISVEHCPSLCAGSSLLIVGTATTGCVFGSSVIGTRSKSPYEQGQAAAKNLIDARPDITCLDPYAQDQIILPMALANGTSSVICGPLTLHTRTAMEIVKKFTKAQFTVEDIHDGAFKITCIGDPPGILNS